MRHSLKIVPKVPLPTIENSRGGWELLQTAECSNDWNNRAITDNGYLDRHEDNIPCNDLKMKCHPDHSAHVRWLCTAGSCDVCVVIQCSGLCPLSRLCTIDVNDQVTSFHWKVDFALGRTHLFPFYASCYCCTALMTLLGQLQVLMINFNPFLRT